jgi:hypothetical protein
MNKTADFSLLFVHGNLKQEFFYLCGEHLSIKKTAIPHIMRPPPSLRYGYSVVTASSCLDTKQNTYQLIDCFVFHEDRETDPVLMCKIIQTVIRIFYTLMHQEPFCLCFLNWPSCCMASTQ